MEITNLDWPDEDGLMDSLVRLCERVYGIVHRVRGGEKVSSCEIDAVRREAVRLVFENIPGAYRPIAAEAPANLN